MFLLINQLHFQVVCKELGYADGKALHGNGLGEVHYGSLSTFGSISNVSCDGTVSLQDTQIIAHSKLFFLM